MINDTTNTIINSLSSQNKITVESVLKNHCTLQLEKQVQSFSD